VFEDALDVGDQGDAVGAVEQRQPQRAVPQLEERDGDGERGAGDDRAVANLEQPAS
jgi:hypothetical protein